MVVAIDRLDRAFNPRTVAVVGDKKASNYMWLRAMETFRGKVFSVQVDEREIEGIVALGVPNYASLLDIPDPVDYVLVAVPRAVAPRIVRDCIAKGVAAASLFTSGFAETSTEEGTRLQHALGEMAHNAGLVLIGPNCMGIFNPKVGLRFTIEQYADESGSFGFISQSGSLAGMLVMAAYAEGVRASKVVSYGNAIIVDGVDYLEYMAADAETRIIGMYIEGLRDGRRFYDTLRRVAAQKPVVIWKGGQTEAGTRATASHTAALAESMAVWNAAITQTGAIRVDSPEEMVDVVKALTFLPPVPGHGVAITGGAGGQSVAMTDAFARVGLRVPELDAKSYEALSEFFVLVGASFRNPIDMGVNRDHFTRILEIVAADPNIDTLVMQLTTQGWRRNLNIVEAQLKALGEVQAESSIPIVAIVSAASLRREAEEAKAVEERLQALGIPSFPTYDRAAVALKKVADYWAAKRQRTAD